MSRRQKTTSRRPAEWRRLKWTVGISVVVVAALRLALVPVIDFGDWQIELPLEVVVVLLTAAVAWVQALFPVRSQVAILQRIASIDTGEAQRPLLTWLRHWMDEARTGIHDLLGSAGWQLSGERFNDLMKRFARASDGQYVGTTCDVPSVFVQRYAWVFERQPTDGDERHHRSCRLLIVTRDALIADRKEFTAEYDRFVSWHARHNIDLFCIRPDKFRKINTEFEIGGYLTLWEHYAVVLSPAEDSATQQLLAVVARLRLRGDDAFDLVAQYVDELQKVRMPLSDYVEGAAASA